MFYRITLDLSFHDQDAAADILDKALDHLSNAVTINPNQPNEEKGHITLQQCYHDEDPTKPCDVIVHHWTP